MAYVLLIRHPKTMAVSKSLRRQPSTVNPTGTDNPFVADNPTATVCTNGKTALPTFCTRGFVIFALDSIQSAHKHKKFLSNSSRRQVFVRECIEKLFMTVRRNRTMGGRCDDDRARIRVAPTSIDCILPFARITHFCVLCVRFSPLTNGGPHPPDVLMHALSLQ